MAGNFGKFIDRSPVVCAAGKPSGDPTQTVSACMKSYRLKAQVDALKHDAEIFEEHREPFLYKFPHLKNTRHSGIYTECRSAIQPPVQTRYQTLIDDLRETSYDSYWNKLQGRTRDPLAGLPAGMDSVFTPFGSPPNRSPPAKVVVNPPKNVYQVLWDSQVDHDMYKKTHDDYNAGEKTNRGYLKPAYNPNKRFGMRTKYDPRGIWARCACEWKNNDPLTSANHIQADVIETRKPKIGKVFAPCNNIECVPKEHMFGKLYDRDLYGMEELLKDNDCPPCIFQRDFRQWMTHLNHLRVYLKRRFNKFGFSLKEFQDRNIYYDKENTGWIPLPLFYEICKCSGVKYEYSCLEPFFRFCGVIIDNKINYRDFVFLADINKSVPEIIKIEDVPKQNQHYVSTYTAGNCDYTKIDNTNMRAAGIPGIRYDLLYPNVPEGGCLADLENLGDETTAEGIVSPSVNTNYGLSYKDFFMPRTAQIIKTIFENIGYEFPDDVFDKLWKIGVERDKTGSVCVDTFKHILQETVPPPRLIVKDKVC